MRRSGASSSPEVLLVEQFTLDAVRNAKNYAREIARYQWDYYAALAQQRAEKSDEIRKALVGAAEGPFRFKGWQRIVDYQYSLHPLSTNGSVLTDPGGRFNVGDIDRTRFSPFPALYLASDQPTAIVEKFGPAGDDSGLSNLDFALRLGPSFSCVSVSGTLDTVINLQHPERLQALVDVIRKFKLPADLAARSSALNLQYPRIVGTVEELVAVVTMPEWRNEPMLADIPAAPQVFGQLVWMAGIEGVLFPSSKNGQTCLAVFPENLSASSYAELDHKAPAGVTALRLDGTNYRNFVP
jgi:RES domain